MSHYSQLPVWTIKHRLNILQDFYVDVVEYFNNCESSGIAGLIENENAFDARRRINLSLQKTRIAVQQSGVSMVITYQPPPLIGGLIQNVDIIQNIFNISQFQISPATVTGALEQAIGVYTDAIPGAWRRTLNPFWWLGRALGWVMHLPFRLIGYAGFNAERAEQSLAGKFTRLVVGAITLLAAFLTVVERLGYMDVFKEYVGLAY